MDPVLGPVNGEFRTILSLNIPSYMKNAEPPAIAVVSNTTVNVPLELNV